jgi:MULE transposase domain/FAR1 DNA-binding domain
MDDTEMLAAEYDDILKMTFESEEQGYHFFNDYAKGKGFSIRRGKLRKSETGSLFFCQFLCSREGFRQQKYFDRPDQKRRACVLTRCGCPVEFCIKLDWSTGEWCVAKFVDTHNHLLSKPDNACFLRSHKKIKNSMRLRILSSQFAGLSTHQILDVLQSKNSGYESVGLVAKDLYNSTHRQKIKKIHLGDAKTVLSRMRERKESDPDFFYKHQVGVDGHLTHLFWSDSQSRLDYGYFGDVLVFDSTCRVNRYNIPIVPFVGLNNHRSTATFGCGIVTDDSADSYKWLLCTFMEAMHQKRPTSIITDGDHAMGEAIKAVLGDITHRWCTWDVDRITASNLKLPSSSALKSLVHTEYTPKEFEGKWKEFIGSNDALKDNKWLSNMYECRRFWAAAFLRKKTFLGIKSNQRNKSLNSRLHRHLDRNMSLLDFIEHYDHLLSRMRRHEDELDHKAFQSVPVTTSGFDLEKHAASIYTPKILYVIQSEILKAKEHEVVKIIVGKGSRTYMLAVEGQDDDFMSVECVGSPKIEKFVCSCQKLECEKVPCSHILAVLIDMKVNCIPQCCVRERWTKSANRSLPLNKREGLEKLAESKMYQDLSNLSTKVLHLASRSKERYLEMKEELGKMLKKFEQVEDLEVQDKSIGEDKNVGKEGYAPSLKDKEGNGPSIEDDDNSKLIEACSWNKTPTFLPMNTKDALKEKIRSFVNGKKKNKCGYCDQRGHSVRTCQLMKEASIKGIWSYILFHH